MSDQPPPYTPPPGYEEYAKEPPPPYTGSPQQPGSYGGGSYGGGYGGSPAPIRPTSVTAVVGFVLAFLLAPIGVVVSAFGIGDTRGGRKSGRGLAVAGVIIGAVLTVALAAGTVALVVFARGAVQAVQDLPTQFPSGLPSDFPSDFASEFPSALPSDLPTDLGADVSDDVVVDACSVDALGVATGGITITNSGDAAGSYVVNLYAYDAEGTKVGELGAVSDSVEPGGSVSAQALGYADEGADIASCEVVQAFRE